MKTLDIHVDETPNDDLPLRILRAYRQRCDIMTGSTANGGEETNPLFIAMNEDQKKRAVILDRAIAMLNKRMSRG